MSRVPADTVLLRVLAATALTATLALAACGDDAPETASTPTASTPVTSPATASTTTPTTPAGGEEAGPDVPNPDEPTPAEAKAALDETRKVAQEAAAKASSEEETTEGLTQQVKRANDALKAAGLQVGKPVVSGEDSAALTVENNTVTVVFMRSPSKAAAAGAAAEKTFAESAQKVRVARKANRLFLLSVPTEPTDKQLKMFRQVRKIVNGAA